jgi:hypothetical protein
MQQHERNDILLFQAEDGKTHLEVQLDHETVRGKSSLIYVSKLVQCQWIRPPDLDLAKERMKRL